MFHDQRVMAHSAPRVSQLCDLKTTGSAPLAQAFAQFQHALDVYTKQKIAA